MLTGFWVFLESPPTPGLICVQGFMGCAIVVWMVGVLCTQGRMGVLPSAVLRMRTNGQSCPKLVIDQLLGGGEGVLRAYS